MSTDNIKHSAESYLDTCALGYAAAVQAGGTADNIERWSASREALHDAGVRLAATLGNLDAAERAELSALRRFHEGVKGLRVEVVAGQADTGEPFTLALVVETIDALLLISSPKRIGESAP